MKIVLATGIYPPDIGGPATYVKELAAQFRSLGDEAVVVSYGKGVVSDQWPVISVSKAIPVLRWWRYARKLKKHGGDADIVIAFSSVSCGVPLRMAKLTKPKKILRLGGDFFWERYTDHGGIKSLREWYAGNPKSLKWMQKLLLSFDHVVFSTRFQEEIYEEYYQKLPTHSVLENALPSGSPQKHKRHEPFRLLFMGRFVGFKNLENLLRALGGLPSSKESDIAKQEIILTLVGDGPVKARLQSLAQNLGLQYTVVFLDPVHGKKKNEIFLMHDLLILPSITEISPNVALEARSNGLPVLLTKETGLSDALTQGMVVRDLSSPEKIIAAITEVMSQYQDIAENASSSTTYRGWNEVAKEWKKLVSSL